MSIRSRTISFDMPVASMMFSIVKASAFVVRVEKSLFMNASIAPKEFERAAT